MLTGVQCTTTDISENADLLRRGKIPLIDQKRTILDHLLADRPGGKPPTEASALLVQYAVETVMGDLAAHPTIAIVNNNRAGQPGHEKQAMKIQFNSPQEAEEFAQNLLASGIHSLTKGPGVPKTAQNNAIYLTEADMEKISAQSKLSMETGTGAKAFKVAVDQFEQQQHASTTLTSPPNDPDLPSSSPSLK